MNLIYKTADIIKNIFLDLFYPRRCILCNSHINIGKTYNICRRCNMNLKDSGKVVRDNDKYFEEAVCALEYSDFVKSSMRDYKFYNIRHLHKTFAYVIYQKIKDREFLKDVSLICPVPLHPSRDREYNQSYLVARHLGTLIGINCLEDLLFKIKNVNPLSKMGYSMRKQMIKSAIAFNITYNIEGKTICVVDDIYTTGTTANECARILMMYGAEKVYILSACYAADKKSGGNINADTDIINN